MYEEQVFSIPNIAWDVLEKANTYTANNVLRAYRNISTMSEEEIDAAIKKPIESDCTVCAVYIKIISNLIRELNEAQKNLSILCESSCEYA